MTIGDLVEKNILGRKLIIDVSIDGWNGKVRTGKIITIYDSIHKCGIEVCWVNRRGDDSYITLHPSTQFEIVEEKKGKGK